MSGTPPSESPSTFADGVRLAIGTLSVFPVRPGVVDRRAAGIAMTAAPFVGALLGVVAGAVLAVALRLGVTPLPASVLAVATLALLTRGLHLDGLADLADGLGSGRPAGPALDIMKKSDIGPFGVVTLVLTLLVQVATLAEVTAAGMGPAAVVVACATGRLALTWACRAGVPSARPGGLGSMVAGTVRRGPALAVTAFVLAGAIAWALLHSTGVLAPWLAGSPSPFPSPGEYRISAGIGDLDAFETAGSFPTDGLLLRWNETATAFWGLPAAVLAGLTAAWALRRRAVRRLGGITGDVLGALVEVATATALVVCAMAVG
ncbi:adenosylcobinamide-GDP ribazoletransferase [Streptosporangium sp. NBC_01756]|uniref:adenosylcobinamide-GDP ribazoletransferase n=1 Tax=Streptosporangium sp. NBC_01756 TaxID=2975950 RepID=UPI002DDA7193|nr:adenosylcobinamide-GDP ribazoletransferase [Streptosporangium sp. NBC_01756]WSC84875.1 adenosylcobinamide-GDP ribazoletransferase [Streptosporangium sp. NBC_01756]